MIRQSILGSGGCSPGSARAGITEPTNDPRPTNDVRATGRGGHQAKCTGSLPDSGTRGILRKDVAADSVDSKAGQVGRATFG